MEIPGKRRMDSIKKDTTDVGMEDEGTGELRQAIRINSRKKKKKKKADIKR